MMTSEEMRQKYFKSSDHPYNKYEEKIESVLSPSFTILDAGCGRTAPILRKFKDKAQKLVGVDLEDPSDIQDEVTYVKGNISDINIPSDSVDVVISRAVLEHVEDADLVFEELKRVLKPGGSFIFLVPNEYDYVALAAKVIPNRYHKKIVAKTEGRDMEDVFPTYYKANSYRSIDRLCKDHGFEIESFEWLGQYPSSLMFSPVLFYIGTMYEKVIARFDSLRYLRGWLLVQLRA